MPVAAGAAAERLTPLALPTRPHRRHATSPLAVQAGMAVAMASVGGMGVIHYNNSLEEQLHQVIHIFL